MSIKSSHLADQPEATVSGIDKDTLSKAYALRSRKLGEAQAAIFRLEQRLRELEQQNRSRAEDATRAIMLRDLKLSKATAELYSSQVEVGRLVKEEARRFKELTFMTRRLLAAEEKLSRLDDMERKLAKKDDDLKVFQDRIFARDEKLKEMSQSSSDKDVELQKLKNEIENYRRTIAERDGQIEEHRRIVEERDSQLEEYRNSSSWRITGPMRAVKRLLRGERPSLE